MDDPVSFDTLLTGARKFSALAMTACAGEDHELFALHAGVAVEHLAKAVLANKNPALLLDLRGGRRSTDMLYHLTGVKSVSAEKEWTIGAAEAISRLRDLEVLSGDRMLDRLVELRNGTAHSGGKGAAEDLLPVFARTVDVLLCDAGIAHDEFWGPWLTAATMAISDAHSKVARDVNLRIQNIRQLYIESLPFKPNGGAEDPRTRIPDRKTVYQVHYFEDCVLIVRMVDCPGCARLAFSVVTATVNDITENHASFTHERLFCGHCQLSLEGQEKLEAAGLELAIDVDLNRKCSYTFEAVYFVEHCYQTNLAAGIRGEEEDLAGDYFLGVTARDYIQERDHYIELIRGRRRSEERSPLSKRGPLGRLEPGPAGTIHASAPQPPRSLPACSGRSRC
jgi:hypothetical protein